MKVSAPSKRNARPPGTPNKKPPFNIRKTATSFPKPKRLTFNFDDSGMFFDYWASIPKEVAEMVDIRLYRTWPIITRSLSGSKEYSIDKFVGPITPDWKNPSDYLLFKYGSGDYKFVMYEIGVPGVVCLTYVRVRDMENHPPRLNPRELLVTDPANASYIESLRMKGIKFPGDPGYSDPVQKEEEDEMDKTVVSQLSGTVIDLAQQVATQAKGNQNNETAASAVVADMNNTAAREAINLVRETARESNAMTKEMFTNLAQATAASQNPIQMFESISKLVLTMNPHKDDSAQATLIANLIEAQNKNTTAQIEFFKRMAERAEERASIQVQAPAPPQPPQRTLLEQLDEVVVLKERLNQLSGTTDAPTRRRAQVDEEEEEKPAAPETNWMAKAMEYAPMVMGGLTIFGSMIANTMYNFSVARSGNGTPMPPPQAPPPGQPVPYGQPPAQYYPPPGMPAPGQPVQQPQQIQSAISPSAPAMDPNDPVTQALEQMRPALLAHFTDPTSDGANFAAWILTQARWHR